MSEGLTENEENQQAAPSVKLKKFQLKFMDIELNLESETNENLEDCAARWFSWLIKARIEVAQWLAQEPGDEGDSADVQQKTKPLRPVVNFREAGYQ